MIIYVYLNIYIYIFTYMIYGVMDQQLESLEYTKGTATL